MSEVCEPILVGMENGQTLQQFIEGWRSVDSDFFSKCKELVDRVVRFLQKHTPYSVSAVVTGGSIGKNTFISENSDVDIIFFINEVTSVQDLQEQVENILDNIRSQFESKWCTGAGHIQFQRRTKHGLQFKLSCNDLELVHDVDILPAFNILKEKGQLQIYDDMKLKGWPDRAYYSVCFAPLQVQFVKLAPIKLKGLIRLLKYWAKKEVNTPDKAISSYCLECIIMHRWQTWGSPDNFKTDEKFEEVMHLLANLHSLHIVWEMKYQAEKYRRIPDDPVILDPANPYINLAPLTKHQNLVSTKASEVMRRIQSFKRYKELRR